MDTETTVGCGSFSQLLSFNVCHVTKLVIYICQITRDFAKLNKQCSAISVSFNHTT